MEEEGIFQHWYDQSVGGRKNVKTMVWHCENGNKRGGDWVRQFFYFFYFSILQSIKYKIFVT